MQRLGNYRVTDTQKNRTIRIPAPGKTRFCFGPVVLHNFMRRETKSGTQTDAQCGC